MASSFSSTNHQLHNSSAVTYHLSLTTRHPSPVTHHLSLTTRHCTRRTSRALPAIRLESCVSLRNTAQLSAFSDSPVTPDDRHVTGRAGEIHDRAGKSCGNVGSRWKVHKLSCKFCVWEAYGNFDREQCMYAGDCSKSYWILLDYAPIRGVNRNPKILHVRKSLIPTWTSGNQRIFSWTTFGRTISWSKAHALLNL